MDDDNILTASTSATSLVTPRTERFSRRRVSGIHIPWTLVRYVHLPLSTPIERAVQTAVRRLLALVCLGGVAALNIQRLVYRPSDERAHAPIIAVTHIDDVDTPASDSSSSPSWDKSKVVALQSIGATMSDFPHVEDHTFALVRLGVGNLRHAHP